MDVLALYMDVRSKIIEAINEKFPTTSSAPEDYQESGPDSTVQWEREVKGRAQRQEVIE